MSDRFRAEKERDGLEFEPLPESQYVRLGNDEITIQTPYSEPLSKLLKALPGARWDSGKRVWRLPYTAVPALRMSLPRIVDLADEASRAAPIRHEPRHTPHPEKTERPTRAMMRSEYLRPAQGRPVFSLTLEAIGDDVASGYAIFGFRSRNWVAQIIGWDGNRWRRSFERGTKDYARANSIGSRGVEVTYLLEEGPIYEIAQPLTWRQTRRFFARVADGKLIELSESEVFECLEK